MIELEDLLSKLAQRGTVWEGSTLLACLVVAYGICWLAGRRRTPASPDSVLFGRKVFDGALFPLLALVLTFTARVALSGVHPVPLLRLAVAVLAVLVIIRLVARVLLGVFPDVGWARVVERIFSWLAWIVAVLWMVGLLPAVMDEMEAVSYTLGKTQLNLLDIIQGLLSAGIVMVLVLWVSAVVERRFLPAVTDLSLRKVASNVLRAALLVMGFLFALSVAGVDLTALSVLGGGIGVGLGFGLQKLASNYVSGFVILAERSLRIGDTVRVDNFEGVVQDIKTRYTLIRSLSGRESVVPNEKLITERIENLSLAGPMVLLTTDVSVGYDSDVDVVQRVLLEAASGASRVVAEPPPSVRLARFGADGLEFTVLFWIADPQNIQQAVRSEVNLRILKLLREAGIEIPFPQRVVHLTSSGTKATD
jgi:small-conductance mechanosensitive channel